MIDNDNINNATTNTNDSAKCGEAVAQGSGNSTNPKDDEKVVVQGSGSGANGHITCTTADDAPGEPCSVDASDSAAAVSTSQLVFFVRHGETDMNAAGRLQGRGVNAHLNGVGEQQADRLGRFVRNVPFDTVISSSLHRAHEVRSEERVDER